MATAKDWIKERRQKKESERVANAMSSDNLLSVLGSLHERKNKDTYGYTALSKRFDNLYKKALDYYNNEAHKGFYDTYSGTRNKQGYVSDTGRWYSELEGLRDSANEGVDELLAELDQYSRYYNEDAVKYVRGLITERQNAYNDAMKDAGEFRDVMSQWSDAKAYDRDVKDDKFKELFSSGDYDAAEAYLDELYASAKNDVSSSAEMQERMTVLTGFRDAIKQKREYAEYKPFWDAIDAGDLESAETFLTEKSTGKRVTEREIDWLGTAANIINNAVYDKQQGVQYAYRDVDKGYADETLQTYWDILNGEKEKKAYADNNAGYLGLMENEDFAEKSKFVSTKQGDREIDWLATIGTNLANSILGAQQGSQTVYKEGQGYEDIIYDIINGNAEAKNYYDIQSLNDHGALAVASGIASSDYLTEMTDDERKIFNYIYATEGKEKAYEYFSHLEKNYLNSRNRKTIEKNWATLADEHPVIASLGTVALAPARGFSFLAQGADLLGDGEIDKNARYNALLYGSNATKSTVSQNIEKSGKWGEVGSFAYDVGMSMGEFLTSTAVSGGNSIFAGLIMGTNAAAETTLSGLDRGLDSTRAFITGTAAGLAEFFTEKMGVDNLLDKALLSKSKFNYVMKNMLSEGIEEGATDIINWNIDGLYDLISGQDKSEWKTAVAEYMDQGYSESEAFGKALGDRLIQLGTDVAAGAASGGIMGGAGAGMQAISEYREAKTKSASRVVRTDADITLGAKIADFIGSVINMQDRSKISKRKLNLGGITKAHQATVDYVMKAVDSNFSSEGYELWMDGTSAEHIVKRHGEKGEADSSMATREAQELIALTVNNPDSAILIKDEAGNLKLSNRYFNADGTKAPQIRLERVLDDGTVYVSECIPDSVNKRIYITSAYVKKGSTDQLLNMDPEGSPQPTPEASFDGSATNSSISQDGTNVNSKISTELMQYAELAGMGENGVQMMQEVYDGKMSPEKFFEAYNAIYASGKRGGDVRSRYVSLLGENVAAMARNAGQMDALKGGKPTTAYKAGERAAKVAEGGSPPASAVQNSSSLTQHDATPAGAAAIPSGDAQEFKGSVTGRTYSAEATRLLSKAKIGTLDTNRSYYKLDDLGIPKEEQQAWIDAGIAKERAIRGQTVVTVNTTVLKDEVKRREKSSQKVLQNSGGSGTIESTQSRRENSDGKESGKEETERSDRRTEGGTDKIQSGTRTQNGNGSRVQGKVGGTSQKAGKILGTSNEGLHRVESNSNAIPFNSNEIYEITNNDIFYGHQQKVVNEYGVDCFVIKKAAWEKLNLDGPAGAYKGKVYVSEDISSELLPTTAPHEGTHIMKQLKYQPYLDFIDKTPEMLDFSSNETARLLGWICDHVGVDYLSMNAAEATRLYDEMNAGIYGFYKAGMFESEGLSEWVPNAFYDFDAYIAELDAIHEQYKQEVKAKRDSSGTHPTDVSSDPDVQQAKENAIDHERVVYSSNKAMAYDAISRDKLDAKQRKVVDVAAQIGRKVIFATTVNKDGVEVDGFIAKNGDIYINPNKNVAPMAFVFKHELAHFAERAGQKYQDFKNTVRNSATFKNWLKEKGLTEQEYISQIIRERAAIGQRLDETQAIAEMMANFVGDMLFTDQSTWAEDLVRELGPKQRKTVREYIRDFFSWIKSKFVGDAGKAKVEVRKLEKAFGAAYRAAVESRAETQESFSISSSLDAELDMVLSGKFDASKNEVYLGETSNFMTEIIGANAFSLYMPASKAYSSLVTEEEYNKKPYYAKQDNYHGIGKADFIDILEKSETPIAAFAASPDESGNKRQNRIVLVTDKIIRDVQSGKDGYAVVVEEVDTKGLRNGKRVNANKTITIYPRTQLFSDIQTAIIDGRILNLSKKGEHLFAGVRGSNPQAAIRKDVLEKNIAHFWMNVKWESEKNKTFSTKEAEMPSAFRLALEKAGYFDQDGHSKYMPKSVDSSQENHDSSSNKSDGGEQFSYTPQNEKIDDVLDRVESGELTLDEARKLLKKPEGDNPASIASLKPEDMGTTPRVNKKTSGYAGNDDSRFAESVKKSSIFSEDFKKEVGEDNFVKHYASITNKETLAEAAKRLDEGGEAYVTDWLSKKAVHMDTVDTMVGFILLKRYQDIGDYGSAAAVAQKVREVGTLSGQRVQAFSIIGRFDADMMQTYAQRELDKAWELAIEGRSDKWLEKHKEQFKLNDEEISFIRDNILYAAKMPENSRERAIALAQITSLIQSKIPPVRGQGFKAWQRVSMLLNPKTQIRNVIGNAMMAPVFVTSDFFSSGIDKIVSLKTNKRTTGITARGAKAAGKGFRKGLYESFDDFRRNIDSKQQELDRYSIGNGIRGQSFDEHTRFKALNAIAKKLNALDDITSHLLDIGDRPFFEMWYMWSLNNQMVKNNVDIPTLEMMDIATEEALERTWQNDTTFSKVASKAKHVLNLPTQKKLGFGLGDVLIKFTKTPANIARAIYEYSPVSFVSAISSVRKLRRAFVKGEDTSKLQKQFVSRAGKAFTGCVIYGIIAALYAMGHIAGAGDEDDDAAAYERYIQGIPDYSIKSGDKWITYDWAQPLGAYVAIVAEFLDSCKNGDSADTSIKNAISAGGGVLMDQSFMSSIQEFFAGSPDGEFDIFNSIFSSILNDVSAMVPTLFSQIASFTDDKKRVTYDNTSEVNTAINRILIKIPGLRRTLEADVDVFGREIPNSQNNFYDAFLNAGNMYSNTSDDITDHAYEIYKSTGDVGAIPAKAPYSVKYQNQSKKLTDEERAEYQRVMGGVAYDMIDVLLENEVYLEMSDNEKLAVLKEVYSYSAAFAKNEIAWYDSYEVIHGIADYITESDFENMTERERIQLVENDIFQDYKYMNDIESDEGMANYLINKKTPNLVLSATLAGDIDEAVKLIEGIEARVQSYGWSDADVGVEVKECRSDVKDAITRYWKWAYAYAKEKGDTAEMERIEEMIKSLGLYVKTSKSGVTKFDDTLFDTWIKDTEKDN